MKIVAAPEWSKAIPDTPPLYDYDAIICPTEVDLKFIAIRHNSEGGIPDYMRDTLMQTDVFVPELPSWNPETASLIRRLAKGDHKAMERMDINALQAKANDPSLWEYNQTVFKALFDSKVGVAFVDYKGGFVFDNYRQNLMAAQDIPKIHSLYKRREQFILQGLSKAVTEARATVRRPHNPLRVTMAYGAIHFGMVDGLKEAAARQDSDMSVSLEFEDSMADNSMDEVTQKMKDHVVEYQTWLRQ